MMLHPIKHKNADPFAQLPLLETVPRFPHALAERALPRTIATRPQKILKHLPQTARLLPASQTRFEFRWVCQASCDRLSHHRARPYHKEADQYAEYNIERADGELTVLNCSEGFVFKR